MSQKTDKYGPLQGEVKLKIGDTEIVAIRDSWLGREVTCADCGAVWVCSFEHDALCVEFDENGERKTIVCQSCYEQRNVKCAGTLVLNL